MNFNQEVKEIFTITPFGILDAFKYIKCGKLCGVDVISAERFVYYADTCSRIHVLLSLLFSAFLSHGYLPDNIMKTASILLKDYSCTHDHQFSFKSKHFTDLFSSFGSRYTVNSVFNTTLYRTGQLTQVSWMPPRFLLK